MCASHSDSNDVITEYENESAQPSAKLRRIELEDDMDWLDDIIVPNSDVALHDDRSERVNREISRYIAEPTSNEKCLSWWKTMEPIFPSLAVLARKYLCIPASSVPSERIFSMAGHIVCRRRALLSPDNINMLIFLNKNHGKF